MVGRGVGVWARRVPAKCPRSRAVRTTENLLRLVWLSVMVIICKKQVLGSLAIHPGDEDLSLGVPAASRSIQE